MSYFNNDRIFETFNQDPISKYTVLFIYSMQHIFKFFQSYALITDLWTFFDFLRWGYVIAFDNNDKEHT